MSLKKVNIEIQNGQLGRVGNTPDNVCGMIIKLNYLHDIRGVLIIGKPYLYRSYQEVIDALGLYSAVNEKYLYQIKDFFLAAGDGAELWVCFDSSPDSFLREFDENNSTYADLLLEASGGRISLMTYLIHDADVVSSADSFHYTLDELYKYTLNVQNIAERHARKNMPYRVIMNVNFMGDLKHPPPADLKTLNSNRVMNVCSSINKTFFEIGCAGFVMGVLASLPVQRKISRRKNPVLPINNARIATGWPYMKLVHESLDERRYVFLHKELGKSNFVFNGDHMSCDPTDDYATMSRGRVMDKAHRIAYDVFSREIDDEILVTEDGKLNPAQVKTIQGNIENRINLEMVANGECSAVNCFIDENQNILSTDTLKVKLSILPVGYKTFIDVQLGFENPALNN